MITITLTPEEKQTLVDLLDCSARDLYSEIVHTDNVCFKQALKERKQIIINMLQTLNQASAA